MGMGAANERDEAHTPRSQAMVLLFDLFVHEGEDIPFMGRPVRTALSAAELSLRYEAELIPFYAIRQPDGLSFKVEMDAPVPHSDPIAMTSW